MILLGINRIAPICIARHADSDVERVAFDITAWRTMYPMLKRYRVEVTSPGGIVYIPETELTQDKLIWLITAHDTAVAGNGMYQIVAEGDNAERKTSGYAAFTVNETMPGTAGDTPPDPAKPWVDKVLDAAQDVMNATVHPPVIGENGSWLLWSFDESAYVDSGIKAQGEPGGKGDPGDPGDPGEPGAPGKDAEVNAQNITAALGYTPADNKDVDRLTEEIAELKKDEDATIPFAKTGNPVAITPTVGSEITFSVETVLHQSGSGDPTPDNVRPISISDVVSFTRIEDGAEVKCDLPQEMVAGSLDTETGVLTLTHGVFRIDGDTPIPYRQTTSAGISRYSYAISGIPNDDALQRIVASNCKTVVNVGSDVMPANTVKSAWGLLYITVDKATTDEEYRQELVNCPVVVVYSYDEPITVQLDPAAMVAVAGTNTIRCNVGEFTAKGVQSAGDSETADVNAFLTGLSALKYGLPELALFGDATGMTKDDAVMLEYMYGDRSGTCSVRWQGSSSLAYDKKNYTVKFDEAFEAKEGWGAQKKYCMKANWIDHSHARNLMCAKLWGNITKSRTGVDSLLSALPNAGAVDGFPIIITLNGAFLGLYTWNIPKDGWMLGMGSGDRECILCAEGINVNGEEAFKAQATAFGEGHGFELEYISDENDTGWALESVNRMITAVMNSDGSDLDTTIAQYLDWDSVIDHYIQTVLTGAADCTIKNYLLCTYDGVKWFFTGYDMDSTLGILWNGKSFLQAYAYPNVASYASMHKAMELVKTYKKDALKARYEYLRKTYMSESDVFTMFANFTASIPEEVFAAERRRWPSIPSTSVSNLWQIAEWYRMRVTVIDQQIAAL